MLDPLAEPGVLGVLDPLAVLESVVMLAVLAVLAELVSPAVRSALALLRASFAPAQHAVVPEPVSGDRMYADAGIASARMAIPDTECRTREDRC